jgi:hypothetical protein
MSLEDPPVSVPASAGSGNSATPDAELSAAMRNRADIETSIRATVSSCVETAVQAQASAVSSLAASQLELSEVLTALLQDMDRVSGVVEGLSLDPATSRHIADARDSLQRTRTRLITVRGRLGRLRGFEESQRLRVAIPASSEMQGRARSPRLEQPPPTRLPRHAPP